MSDVLGVIPARWGSTRLPGKPLLDLNGKPVIQHVYERCMEAKSLDKVLVATDDRRIFAAVESFGGRAVFTSPDHPNGTCRVAEATANEDCRLVINIQGDEPLVDPEIIDLLARTMVKSDCPMGTVGIPVEDESILESPNVVKVVADVRGRAMYFSRSVIPYRREGRDAVLRHLGLYAYRKEFLPVYVGLSPTPLSESESLEQLKALEWGYPIALIVTRERWPSVGIDVASDLERVRKLLARQ